MTLNQIQSAKEQKERGDTLEQYAVFQKYEVILTAVFKHAEEFLIRLFIAPYLFAKEQLDKHMDSFVTKEGFKTVEQCFEAIDRFAQRFDGLTR